MPELTWLDPGEIDGEPSEVARAAAEQLASILDQIAPLAQATFTQVRNAGLSEALAAGETADPGALQDWWRVHRPGSARVSDLAYQLGVAQRLARRLAEDVREGR
jgi:hypothetical protein